MYIFVFLIETIVDNLWFLSISVNKKQLKLVLTRDISKQINTLITINCWR